MNGFNFLGPDKSSLGWFDDVVPAFLVEATYSVGSDALALALPIAVIAVCLLSGIEIGGVKS